MASPRPGALAALALLVAGCGQPKPVPPGPAPRSSPSATATATATAAAASAATPAGRRELAAAYLRIAVAGNRRLDADFDGLEDRGTDLVAARADLRDAAATERLFDARLLRLTFPPATELIVHLLVWVNQARAGLSVTAAGSASLRELDGYRQRLAQANAPVEQAVTIIRSWLSLPPPDTS